MTRKDFNLIADTIAEITDTVVKQDVAERFARSLRTTNPRFDTARFIKAATS